MQSVVVLFQKQEYTIVVDQMSFEGESEFDN